MDFIFEKCFGVVSIVDDIVVYGLMEKEYDVNLYNLMLVVWQYGFVFNLDKCYIKESKIIFFGMLFDLEGVYFDLEKVEVIRVIQELQDIQEF